jgi:hypothetical protein
MPLVTASYYQSALELAPAGSAERAQLLYQLGRTRFIGGDLEPDLLAAACVDLAAAAEPEAAAEAESALAELYSRRGDTGTATCSAVRTGKRGVRS